MLLPRIIPVLLLRNNGLYKTTKFDDPKYIGDPLNAVKVFNEKEVDEIIVLDYQASSEKRAPSYDLIEQIASQCFMPVCFGGGIQSIDQIKRIVGLGVEKIALNTIVAENPSFLEKAASIFGSSTLVVSIDLKKNIFGNYTVYTRSGKTSLKVKPEVYAKQMENSGAGELLINSITRDGTMQGYDLELISLIASEVRVPVIACGGAGKINDFKEAFDNGASAMAAGSFFVFHGKHRGVLISYPSQENLENIFR